MKTHVIGTFFTMILMLLTLIGPPTASADRMLDNLNAYAAYKAGNYAEARKLWQALADQGDTTAMNNLANMFDQGRGSNQDPEAAAQWLRKAAEQGDRIAQLNLGLAYENGRGVARDNHAAAEWFRRAAHQGLSEAQFNLGVMLATAYGAGVGKATAAQRGEAQQWLGKAARQGHPQAAGFLQLLQARPAR